MAASLHPAAPHHLPLFITAPGDTDVLMVAMGVLLFGAVLMFGIVFLRLHSLPERMAHRTHKLQFEIVAVLCLLALFTHVHLFWVAALLLALVDLPDIGGTLGRIAGSVEKMAGVKPGDRVLTMTGRHTQYRTPHSHDRPYITEEAMRWLVEDRKIACLGTDSSGFEVRGVSHYPNHRLLNHAGIPALECLTNLVELRTQRIFLIALPIPVKGLDASPVRAIAIEPESE